MVESLELLLCIACFGSSIPEVLVCCQGALLPVTGISCVAVVAAMTGGEAAAAAVANRAPSLDVLIFKACVPLEAAPDDPGLVVVEILCGGPQRVDDVNLAAGLQAAAEAWRGPLMELNHMLQGMAGFLHHARCLSAPGALGGDGSGGGRGDGNAAPPSPNLTVELCEHVVDLGLYLLVWMASFNMA